jgi:hypothetical protein
MLQEYDCCMSDSDICTISISSWAFITIVSDWGTQFVSSLWKESVNFWRLYERMFTAYHLKTDRATEQMNQNVELYICMFLNYSQNNWASLLLMTELVINNHDFCLNKWASSSCLMSITWSLYNYLRSWSLYDLQKVQYRKLIKLYRKWKKSQSEHRWLWLSLSRYRRSESEETAVLWLQERRQNLTKS